MDRTRRRGFTLLELMVVVAIIGILAAAAGAMFSSATRNASAASAAFDLVARLQGLKTKAVNEQTDYVVVLVSPTDGVTSSCGVLMPGKCLRWFVLGAPSSGWRLGDFDPASPATGVAAVVERESLPGGLSLDLDVAGAAFPTPPFTAVRVFDSTLRATCSGYACIAVRFGADGEVRPVYSGASSPLLGGVAFAVRGDSVRGEARMVLVSFPTGIVKAAPYQSFFAHP